MIRFHTFHRLVLSSLAAALLVALLGGGAALAQTDQTGALRVAVADADGGEMVFGIDVFNLLNDDAARSVVTTVNEQDPSNPSTLFGTPLRRLPPRTTRLYLSLRF